MANAAGPFTASRSPLPHLDGSFSLHHQPLVDLSTGAPVGVEGLLRWHHPRVGWVPPSAWLPFLTAQQHDSVLDYALQEALRWVDDSAPSDIPVSVNVEPSSLNTALLERLCDGTIAAGSVKLEVTEGGLAAADEALFSLEALRRRGFGVALDDFGTGHSTLARLHHLPVDQVKVDRRLFHAARTSARAAAILRCVTTLAVELGVTSVAEGVETLEDAASAKQLGFDIGQGFFFARPMPSEASSAWLDAQRALPDPAPWLGALRHD